MVSTSVYPAAIHLSSSFVAEMAKNSQAYFEAQSTGQIQVQIQVGTLSFRDQGRVVTLPSGSDLRVSEQGTIAFSAGLERGVVAVLREEAASGARFLKLNDVERTDPSMPLVVASRDGKSRETACAQSIDPHNLLVHLRQELEQPFQAQTPVRQDTLLTDRPGPVALLASTAAIAQKVLSVDHPEGINPSSRILLRSARNGAKEVHHIRAIDGSLILLTEALRQAFEPGVLLYQKGEGSVPSDDSSPVGSLARAVQPGARGLELRGVSPIDSLGWILIRDESGRKQEVHCIRYARNNQLLLASSLESGFPEGAELHQGLALREALQDDRAVIRTENCSRCPAMPPGSFTLLPTVLGLSGFGAGRLLLVNPRAAEEETPASDR